MSPSTENKLVIGTLSGFFGLLLLGVAYKALEYRYEHQQRLDTIKSVLAQSQVADMNTLTSCGFIDPVFRRIYENDAFYFQLNSCCSERQFSKTSRKLYKARAKTEWGQSYEGWSGGFRGKYFPQYLAKGSFGDAQVQVQGKPYNFKFVNDRQDKKTTIIIIPADR